MTDATRMIVADIGNSALKLARVAPFPGDTPRLEQVLRLPHGKVDDAALAAWAPNEEHHWYVSSVHQEKLVDLFFWIQKNRPNHFARQLVCFDLDLKIAVEAPTKVGVDRLLSAVAANQRRSPHCAALTLTAGTAVTINAIDAKGVFLGGAILPGWSLMAASLHDYTDALPRVENISTAEEPIGKNTHQAIRSGLYFGLLGAVQELIARMEKQMNADAEVFIAGGDAETLHAGLGRGVLAPDLVLEGAAITGQRLLGEA